MFGIYKKTFNISKMIHINSFSLCALVRLDKAGKSCKLRGVCHGNCLFAR
jgi:hypothetical protein